LEPDLAVADTGQPLGVQPLEFVTKPVGRPGPPAFAEALPWPWATTHSVKWAGRASAAKELAVDDVRTQPFGRVTEAGPVRSVESPASRPSGSEPARSSADVAPRYAFDLRRVLPHRALLLVGPLLVLGLVAVMVLPGGLLIWTCDATSPRGSNSRKTAGTIRVYFKFRSQPPGPLAVRIHQRLDSEYLAYLPGAPAGFTRM
jgi:hypothetical protein